MRARNSGLSLVLRFRHPAPVKIWLCPLVLLTAISLSAAEEDKLKTTRSESGRFSIGIPQNWVFEDPKGTNTKTVMIARQFREPYPDYNPSVRALVIPTPAKVSALAMMNIYLAEVRKEHKDLSIIHAVRPVKLDGRDASYVRVALTADIKEANKALKVERVMTVIPREKNALVLYMSGSGERGKFPEKTFHAILSSLKVED